MNHLKTLQSMSFKRLFLDHFVFDNGHFIDNEECKKEDFYYRSEDVESKKHDELIANSYAFFECDQGLYLLYDGVIFYCDSESSIIPLGDNPLNFTRDMVDKDNIFDVHKALDYNGFNNSMARLFGSFSLEKDEAKINGLIKQFHLDD